MNGHRTGIAEPPTPTSSLSSWASIGDNTRKVESVLMPALSVEVRTSLARVVPLRRHEPGGHPAGISLSESVRGDQSCAAPWFAPVLCICTVLDRDETQNEKPTVSSGFRVDFELVAGTGFEPATFGL
jgi:hypothetical protein